MALRIDDAGVNSSLLHGSGPHAGTGQVLYALIGDAMLFGHQVHDGLSARTAPVRKYFGTVEVLPGGIKIAI